MSDGILARLHAALPPAAFRAPSPTYLSEPRGRWQGQATAIVAPGSTAEVQAVIAACAETATPVVPFGGGTGLVGGQIAEEGPAPVLLSTERMTAIGGIDAEGGTLIAQAGAVLSDIHAAAEAEGMLFPLTLASQGSARIGGLLSTNAGGINVLRYGTARDLCLGIEAVLPDGACLTGLKPLRKDNTGYDLKDLLIGAEGTLGVITAAVLRLFPHPQSSAASFMVVPGPKAALALLRRAQAQLGPAISAFELISGQGLHFMQETGTAYRAPFAETPEWMCLIDLGMTGDASAAAGLEALFAKAYAAGEVLDGVISQSVGQRAEFWALREAIPAANRRIGAVSSHDISVPVAAIPAFIQAAPARIAQIGDFRINCFGHLGDGNLHYNVFPQPGRSRADHDHQRRAIKRAVHDLVDEMGGSVSAEHGIGRLKVEDLERYGDPTKLAAMRAIKAALDPAGIMNPGAVLRAETAAAPAAPRTPPS